MNYLEMNQADRVGEMSEDETGWLEYYERVIEENPIDNVFVGDALMAIKGKNLYRGTQPTFAAYCEDKLDITLKEADYFIALSSSACN